MDALEKRKFKRVACNCEASWSYFNKEPSSNCRILNFSPAGSYLEIDHPMMPGATVLIRVLQCHEAPKGYPEGLPVNAIAEVKWCREIDTPNALRHGAGVRYHFPA